MDMQYLTASFSYVTGDRYFWLSMAITFIIGMFISSSIYNGEVKEVKKLLIGLSSYASLIIMTTSARIYPQIIGTTAGDMASHPFAGIMTIFVVTLFYAFGMAWGIRVVYHAKK